MSYQQETSYPAYGGQAAGYNPYQPGKEQDVSQDIASEKMTVLSANRRDTSDEPPTPYIDTPSKPPRPLPGVTTYRSVSWLLGFRDPYSLLLGFVLGGALIGFCLARTMMFAPSNVRTLTTPGEWFWYQQPLFKAPIFIHIYLTIIGGIGVVFQFIPAIRRRYIVLHRINGYICLILIIVGTVTGSIVARRAFGGDINLQAAFYFMGIIIVFAGVMGWANVRTDTRQHRKWMLRFVSYLGISVTARLSSLATRQIATVIGTYYSLWRCDELLSVITLEEAAANYPSCASPGVVVSRTYVAVHAAMGTDRLGFASAVRVSFGMCIWVAMVLHIVGAEVYIRMTDKANAHKRGYILEKHDSTSERKA